MNTDEELSILPSASDDDFDASTNDVDEVVDSPDASMRNDFESAISKLQTKGDADEVVDASETVRDQAQQGDEENFTPEDSKVVDKVVDKVEDTVRGPVDADSRPPVGWKDAAAESWKDVPQAARDHIQAREREINVVLQQTADSRRFVKEFGEVVGKYRQPLEDMGYRDPLSAVNGILSSAMQLRTGTSQQRAQAAASIIQDFGIDIEELDNALAGGTATQSRPQQHDFEAVLDRRLGPINNFMTQLEAMQIQQQQSAKIATENEVRAFMEQQEFAEDVRMDMADLLDLAASRGQNMTLQQAYEKACLLNDDVSRKIQSRQASEREQAALAERERKQHAASSVRGVQGGRPSSKSPETIADAINQAWDLHTHG